MTLEDAERIVQKVYPGAFPFVSEDGMTQGWWSICTGQRTEHGNIRIPLLGWHERVELAWLKAGQQLAQQGK